MVLEAENSMGMFSGAKHWLKLSQTTVNVSGQTGCGKRWIGVMQNELSKLNPRLRNYVEEKVRICQPDQLHVCDGSEREYQQLIHLMQSQGALVALPKYKNCYLSRTDPADVARVESKTFIATKNKRDTIPETKPGVKGMLGNWMSEEQMDATLNERFPGCMKGRTMYVIPFSMGPINSPLSKLGLQLTDSPYVAASMRIMTRMGAAALQSLNSQRNEFIKCLHSVGQPLPMLKPPVNSWPCDPERTIIAHLPDRNEICSFGSGYGGNSLLGKKCFALRLGSNLGRRQGWLAEHMLILSITNPAGQKKYLVAAFPSACGKTNLAMMQPTLPGYKVECVGDDIAWMRFDEQGQLRAINPEAGFFGVAPGTSYKTNPNAMRTIESNTIFTNVGMTDDGGVFWEGMEDEVDVSKTGITTWLGERYDPKSGKPAAHPNSRFCTPASQCPIIDEDWQSPAGVPISGIIFGGRRPEGVPLIYEAFDWAHGVMVGAAMRSESTAAAEHRGKQIMHDPFAMRPFFGYNFGHYLQHWLNFAKPGHPQNNPKGCNQLPKIFHVNWFRKDKQNGQFLWPGFGENSRVLDWVCRRIDNEDCAVRSAIGLLPSPGSLNLTGLKAAVDEKQLFDVEKRFWLDEVAALQQYFDQQLPEDLPTELREQLEALKLRVQQIPDTQDA